MQVVYDDGGRAAAGYKGNVGDCCVRAFAIAGSRPYQEVYDMVNTLAASERTGKRKRGKSNARTGVFKVTAHKLAAMLGFEWTPTMLIGQGCKVHLHDGELPNGRLVVSVSKHYTAVLDGVIHDTHDPQREVHCFKPGSNNSSADPDAKHWIERRCVYGYWHKP